MKRTKANEKIAILMRQRGLKQSEVSEQIKINKTNLGKYLRGLSDIRSDSLLRLLKLIGIDIDEDLNLKIREHLEGIRLKKNYGHDIEHVLNSLDKLDRKTILETIISRGKEAGLEESDSIKRLQEVKLNTSISRGE